MKTMTAKYPGVCKRTGAKIHVGDQINYFGRGHAELVQPSNEPRQPDAPCWECGSPEGYFRNRGAAAPVWCDKCNEKANPPKRQDNSSCEDSICGDLAYEDRCREACGL